MQIGSMGTAQPKGVAGLAPKAAQQATPKQLERAEEVSLHQPPKWAQALIQQTLQFSLEVNGQGYQAPKLQEPEEITPETLFDFQAVADNVLQFVTGRIGAARVDGKSDDDLGGMMEQARKGVDKGFEEAKRLLGKWATDNEDIKTGIDQSYKLIQEGLDEFEKNGFKKVSATNTAQTDMVSDQRGQLEIQTKEGDKVMLRFNDSWQSKAERSENGSQFSFKSSQSFSFSLEGDLNNEEMDSIGKLVKGIDELAGSFFSGNFEELLEQASELKLDDSQLASYSLKFKQSTKISQAYQGAHSLQDLLKPFADYLPKLDQTQKQANALLPPSEQQGLSPAVLAARGEKEPQQLDRFTSFNQRMLEALRMADLFQPSSELANKHV